MRSPFPGMDPYIEAFGLWEDFHTKLIGEMERNLSSLVPDRYVVRTGERSYVAIGGPGDDDGHEIVPDVTLAAPRAPEVRGGTAAATPGTGDPDAAPALMQAMFEAEYREVFLEIHQTDPAPARYWNRGAVAVQQARRYQGLASLPPQTSGVSP